ncbi:ANTAR domain-containing protein [Nocardioides sp. MAH-18]|uniref:ANTAR domain-containing protein n=1 Tax=Nocardioides agri TaxID=2682843 RepID=A0A6L6XUU0_9ACTN|nr:MULTISPECIES: GAF and ANTAR domain-containing protein [unclassified Nocardioides]MBA2955406.1 GAF and ANTAR domain-containing protein [Nocardioides sp. CGMCC 1.13656]MVQ50256.1 ANTAR domain-containing protein [Nocardioides sp. MAH-18]
MSADAEPERSAREAALQDLAASAASTVPGADAVSITVRRDRSSMQTLAATAALAERADRLQYEFQEGPCYEAVTDNRFVLVNDLTAAVQYPRYAPRAVELGIGAQAAVQLLHDGENAGLNMYASTAGAFDRATVQIAELFASHAATLLGYAVQVEQLSEALQARTDIGMAVGMVMERYQLDRERAFAFLVRLSNNRNVKLRVLARQLIDGTFEGGTHDRP